MPFKKGETPKGANVFQKGESGNPNGRPAGGKNRATIAKKILEMAAMFPPRLFKSMQAVYPELQENMTAEEIATIVMVGRAITKGDVFAYNAIMDSAYGKAKQEIEHNGEFDLQPLKIKIIPPSEEE